MEFEWRVASAPVPYPEALEVMEKRVAEIEAGTAPELFWLVEHPPLYTKGTSAAEDELIAAQFPVYDTGRGGRFTYHGPGQRVIYALCDLRKRGRDVRAHVCRLEDWVIRVLQDFGIKGERREGRVGIWVTSNSQSLPLLGADSQQRSPPLEGGVRGGVGATRTTTTGLREPTPRQQKLRLSEKAKPKFLQPPPQGGRNVLSNTGAHEEKIAAIGVRVRRWITYHGLSFNVNPDLAHYNGIVPCGLPEFGVTSLAKLGVKAGMGEVDEVFRREAEVIFES